VFADADFDGQLRWKFTKRTATEQFPQTKASVRLPNLLSAEAGQIQTSQMHVSKSMLLQCAQLLPMSAKLWLQPSSPRLNFKLL
jgi:hypothetical protein